MTETVTGTDRSAGISYAELLDQDTHPVSDVFRAQSPMPPGPTKVPAWYYHSQAVHELEVERLWGRTWQMACLEAEIPGVGDYHVYEVADLSFLLVRTGPDEIKCYRNACLHRGRRLRDKPGKGAKSLRCPFHGWNWNLDGSLKEIPCQWDFPSVEADEYSLPEATVGVWQGFVFINPDRDAEPLEDFLEGLTDHFAALPFDRKYKAVHVAKVLRCNWKACQEAFMEAYHVVATHPTLMLDLGDANSRYDVYKNFSRAVSPHGVESPHMVGMTRHEPITDAKMFSRYQHPFSGFIYERVETGVVRVTNLDGIESTFTDDGDWIDGPTQQADPHLCKWVGGQLLPDTEDMTLPVPSIPDGVSKRAFAAESRRAQLRAIYGDTIDVDAASDAELIDAIFYSVFPNWSPWGVFNEINYRFRPNGNNPNEAIFEVMYFRICEDQDNPPPPAKVHWLDVDEDYINAPELGVLAKVLQQDVLNLPNVQRGLRAQEQQEVIFADYNESKIRHFYANYDKMMELDGEVPVALNIPSK